MSDTLTPDQEAEYRQLCRYMETTRWPQRLDQGKILRAVQLHEAGGRHIDITKPTVPRFPVNGALRREEIE